MGRRRLLAALVIAAAITVCVVSAFAPQSRGFGEILDLRDGEPRRSAKRVGGPPDAASSSSAPQSRGYGESSSAPQSRGYGEILDFRNRKTEVENLAEAQRAKAGEGGPPPTPLVPVGPGVSRLPSLKDAADALIEGRLDQAEQTFRELAERYPLEPAHRLAAEILSRPGTGGSQ